MVSDRRVQVIEFLAGFLDLPTSSLDDRFDVVNDFDWSQWDDEDYGLLFEQFMERFAVRDARFDFGGRYRGPLILKPLAWLWWRLFHYPRSHHYFDGHRKFASSLARHPTHQKCFEWIARLHSYEGG